ncbi:GNAT family N-acetyltransferase [Myceligenerans pegani]|uniref:N-acetyltransferase n=1 Tax=Myceligenerans pegani TaxID=2776917 RepID=A0ABR9MYU1_9MICO|nr:GNAT family N-acetyltransferase [Myceligenerans sp. TRM 65318]MBE1876544.1 N-acetyltransferase [Myceligenerans sp. TRM 65318]MBE3018815.1 N-acetyltransferase [Myceligenerans sp. TRM 65318]
MTDPGDTPDTPPTDTPPTPAGHPDGPTSPHRAGPLDDDQKALIGEVTGDRHRGPELTIVKDERAGIYDALTGDQEIGGLTYNDAGDRVVLLAVSIFPQFRNQGAATELIHRVLDDIRAQGKTATILCPIVRTFIDRHPEYRDVVDPEHPGVVRVASR